MCQILSICDANCKLSPGCFHSLLTKYSYFVPEDYVALQLPCLISLHSSFQGAWHWLSIVLSLLLCLLLFL